MDTIRSEYRPTMKNYILSVKRWVTAVAVKKKTRNKQFFCFSKFFISIVLSTHETLIKGISCRVAAIHLCALRNVCSLYCLQYNMTYEAWGGRRWIHQHTCSTDVFEAIEIVSKDKKASEKWFFIIRSKYSFGFSFSNGRAEDLNNLHHQQFF